MPNEWGFVNLAIYFSPFTANLNVEFTFIFYLLYRQFEGALNGISTSGARDPFDFKFKMSCLREYSFDSFIFISFEV